MAVKIYKQGGVIAVEGLRSDIGYFTPTANDFWVSANDLGVTDSITKEIVKFGAYTELTNENDESFANLAEAVDYVSGLFASTVTVPANTPEWRWNINAGKVPGFSVVDKFGINPVITSTSDPEDVWEFGGLYNFDTNNTAPIKYLSSSEDADTEDIKVTGLDINGVEVTQTKTLTGETVVTLDTPLWRVYRLENEGTANLTGILYCHTDPTPTAGVPTASTVRAIIDDGNNQTLMALYTIPLGKVGFLYKGEIGLSYTGTIGAGTNFAKIYYQSRRYGKVFTIKKVITVISAASSNFQDTRSFPDIIPALTDIKINTVEVSEDMGIWATFDILLVDETEFTQAYLTAIGQPTST